ncbi:MAG: DMT family transporter [Chloroflexi bacterium]|nr:DMT family transporter [Chloroflexota bacterium]
MHPTSLRKPQARLQILRTNPQLVGTLAVVGGAVGIGFVPIFVRLSDVGPIAVAFWRFALAAPLLLAWQSLSLRPQSSSRPGARPAFSPWLLVPGLFFTADLSFYHLSIRYTTIANATLFTNMAPIVVSIIAWRFLGERFRALFVVGLTLSILGAVLMIRSSANSGGSHLLGDALGLLSPLFYAGYLLTVRRLRADYSSSTIMLASAITASFALFLLTLITREQLLSTSWQGWLLLLTLAWFSHVGGQGLITYALAQLPAALTSVILLFQPVFSTLIAWVWLGETIGALQILGGICVLLGIFLAQRNSDI